MDKIYTGNDRAKELKFRNFQEMIFALAKRNNQAWNGKTNYEPASGLVACVNAGRWAVMCECGNGSYADPDYCFAFCAVCGNASTGGDLRVVIFPDNRAEIEAALLEREIKSPFDIGTQGIFMPVSQPAHKKMHRSWLPGETIEHIKQEYQDAKAPGDESHPIPAVLRKEGE